MSSTPVRPSFSSPSAPVSAATPAAAGDLQARFEALRKRYDGLRERRIKRELELENAKNEVNACVREAESLGVSSLEELESLIERQTAEDAAALSAFEAALDEETKVQDQVDQALAQADLR